MVYCGFHLKYHNGKRAKADCGFPMMWNRYCPPEVRKNLAKRKKRKLGELLERAIEGI